MAARVPNADTAKSASGPPHITLASPGSPHQLSAYGGTPPHCNVRRDHGYPHCQGSDSKVDSALCTERLQSCCPCRTTGQRNQHRRNLLGSGDCVRPRAGALAFISGCPLAAAAVRQCSLKAHLRVATNPPRPTTACLPAAATPPNLVLLRAMATYSKVEEAGNGVWQPMLKVKGEGRVDLGSYSSGA